MLDMKRESHVISRSIANIKSILVSRSTNDRVVMDRFMECLHSSGSDLGLSLDALENLDIFKAEVSSLDGFDAERHAETIFLQVESKSPEEFKEFILNSYTYRAEEAKIAIEDANRVLEKTTCIKEASIAMKAKLNAFVDLGYWGARRSMV